MITIKAILGMGFNMIQAKKVLDAMAIWTIAWNGAAFKPAVLAASFTQTTDNSALVFATIEKTQDKTVHYEINNVPNGSETAATDTVTGVTTLQVAWINSATLPQLANTESHEYTHTLEGGSYKHSYLYSRWVPYLSQRPWSVPYQIGDITERLTK